MYLDNEAIGDGTIGDGSGTPRTVPGRSTVRRLGTVPGRPEPSPVVPEISEIPALPETSGPYRLITVKEDGSYSFVVPKHVFL